MSRRCRGAGEIAPLHPGTLYETFLDAYNTSWLWHFGIGAALAAVTWYLTIRGRGESAQVVFTGLRIFVMLTVAMAVGLLITHLQL